MVHLGESGNLLLELVKEPESHDAVEREKRLGIDKLALFAVDGKEKGKKVAEVFNTIASVSKPLYLAKPLAEVKDWNGVLLTSTRN